MNKAIENVFFSVLVAFLLSMIISACKVVGGIFQAGMGVGVFMTLAIVALVIVFLVRLSRKR